MSGFSKVEMSAPRSLWRHGGDGGVDDGGTGSAAGHVPAGGAAADPAPGGRAARAERAPDPPPVPRVPARRRQGPGVPPSRAAQQSPVGHRDPRASAWNSPSPRSSPRSTTSAPPGGISERHGKPMAFYSDRLSVFRVHPRERAQNGRGLSQFGRALRELNIDLLCARSPEAKGRVERANGTLQDRLVKELRLRGLNDPVAAAPFLPEFMADYNRRFAKPPAVAYDAHRPLRPGDDLTQLFTLQETRRISRQLTVHYKRDFYVLDDTVATRRRRGATVVVSEAEDGTVTMRINGRVLAARLYPKGHAQLDPGAALFRSSRSRRSSPEPFLSGAI